MYRDLLLKSLYRKTAIQRSREPYYIRERNIRTVYQTRDISEERDGSWKKSIVWTDISRMGKDAFLYARESH